jgi:hypothetical protein
LHGVIPVPFEATIFVALIAARKRELMGMPYRSQLRDDCGMRGLIRPDYNFLPQFAADWGSMPACTARWRYWMPGEHF